MNAIELANKLEDYFDSDYDEIVTMLRQQQAEIEALKVKLRVLIREETDYETAMYEGGNK